VNASAPFLIHPFPEWHDRLRAAFTVRRGGGRSTGTYADLNLGFRAGDAPDKVARNWETVLAAAGLAGKPLVIPRMVHGDAWADADALPDAAVLTALPSATEATGGHSASISLRRLEPENADALWSRSSRRVLAVTMADCLTALIFDPESRTIAAVHAGWRGTQARILEKTLRHLADTGRIRAENTLVAFGPCLRRETLEVGEELGARLDQDFIVRKAGRFFLDMPAANRAQALATGITDENIRDMAGDTLLEPERYFSYRRDGQASGRMAAFISLL